MANFTVPLHPIGERVAKLVADKVMLLMACDQCVYEGEIDGKLVDGVLSGNMPDQIITL